jgi:hypothetical protein
MAVKMKKTKTPRKHKVSKGTAVGSQKVRLTAVQKMLIAKK